MSHKEWSSESGGNRDKLKGISAQLDSPGGLAATAPPVPTAQSDNVFLYSSSGVKLIPIQEDLRRAFGPFLRKVS